jgi:hypothetical protein
MTHSGGKPHDNIGDRGQRYEVRCLDEDGAEKVIGWTDDPTGGGLVRGVDAHPAWRSPRVIDRRAHPTTGGDHG